MWQMTKNIKLVANLMKIQLQGVRYFSCLLLLIGTTVIAGTATTASAQSGSETIKKTLPKVVKVFGAGGIQKLHAYGSGCLVSDKGHIITIANHIIDTDILYVVLNDGRRLPAKLIQVVSQLDLAVIKIDRPVTGLKYFDLSKESKEIGTATAGTRILSFSNMFKVAAGDEPVSVMHGVIAAKTKELSARSGTFATSYKQEAYIIDAITNNPGSGGGALMSRSGKLLGLVGRELRNSQTNTWVNYAVPIEKLTDAVQKILDGKIVIAEKEEDSDPDRYSAIDFGIVMLPNVITRTPAYIGSVVAGSAAAKVKLQRDDLILLVQDEVVHSQAMLEKYLGRLEAGQELTIMIRRGKKLVEVTLPVPEKEEEEDEDNEE